MPPAYPIVEDLFEDEPEDRHQMEVEDEFFNQHQLEAEVPDEYNSSSDNDDHIDYREILSKLSKQWLLTEISHRVSKEGSNKMWELANKYFATVYDIKKEQGIKKKIPQFQQIRNKLYDSIVPKVKMEIAYERKETGEVSIVEDVERTPVSQFPPSTHRRLYEIASVDVSLIFPSYYFFYQ